MPVYKNRPSMAPDTAVWRYMSLDALLATVRDGQLRFTRIDTLKTPSRGLCRTNDRRPSLALRRRLPDEGGVYHSRSASSSRGNVTPRMGGPLGENHAPAPR